MLVSIGWLGFSGADGLDVEGWMWVILILVVRAVVWGIASCLEPACPLRKALGMPLSVLRHANAFPADDLRCRKWRVQLQELASPPTVMPDSKVMTSLQIKFLFLGRRRGICTRKQSY